MPPQVAFFLYWSFIIWLFVRDYKQGSANSKALWIPFLWVVIVGSRPFSLWFNFGQLDSSVDYSEGSPVDRFAFLWLILAGVVVLSKRRVNLGSFISNNKWLCVFYLFWLLSTVWSPNAFVAFKRWFKDVGNLVMVLVILSDENPLAATRAVFNRVTYVLIPLSVLFIKYYPDTGRVYNHWTWQPTITGVTTDKNALGELVLVCGLFFLAHLLSEGDWRSKLRSKQDLIANGLLLVMMAWLLSNANSATSLVCMALGAAIFLGVRFPAIRSRLRYMEVYALLLIPLVLFLSLIFPVMDGLMAALGRNSTLTDRTQIWELALGTVTSPILGTGFYSYWTTHASEKVTDIFEGVNQAHNGYLETYLNGGAVGVILLVVLLLISYIKIKKELLWGSDFAVEKLVLLIAAMLHNITEASFNRVSIIWFISLIAIINMPEIAREHQALGADEVEAENKENFSDLPEEKRTIFQ